ncbi:MAG: type II secretion system F family protein [Zetaproteobacteria bacterium]|nr:type II secretion system F family protein [Zetaproteobacteria bacterium]
MPIFVYKGYDVATGAVKKGKIEAESARQARQRLKTKEKIIASDLKEEVTVTAKGQSSGGLSLFQSQSVPLKEMAIMSRQFATLQRAHVPLDECLMALTGQVENKVLSNTLSAVRGFVSEGKSLGDAISQYPQIFSKLYINMVRAGESSGNLGLIMERLADYLEYQLETRGKIMSAMMYPIIMVVAAVAITLYLFLSVVPKLASVFDSMRAEIPPMTKFVLGFSDFLQSSWYLLFGAVAIAALAFRAWFNTESGRKKFDSFILGMPLIGPIVMRVNVSKFTQTLSTLLSSGVQIIAALEITKNVIANTVIAGVIDDAKTAVQEGEALWVPIDRSQRFPSLVTYMVRTGERTGELENMLKHMAEAYDAEVERKIGGLISLLSPIMMGVMFGIVVLVIVSVLLPMMSIMNQVR